MFYCRNCKKSSDSPNCPICGKLFERADEIINCPNCNKMFFKPNNDFTCTKCGNMVQINPPQQQANQMNFAQNNNIPNPNMFAGQSFVPPNPFLNQQTSQLSNNNNIKQQNQAIPNNEVFNQTIPNQQNIQVQPSQNFDNFQQSQTNNFVQESQAQTQPNNFSQNSQPMQQEQVINNPQKETFVESNIQPMQQIQQNNNMNNVETNTNELASLFGQTNFSADQTQANAVDFNQLRAGDQLESNSTIQNDDGKVYDENGYEVIDMSGGKKSKKKKKDKKSAKSQPSQENPQDYFNQNSSNKEVEVVKSGKGIKIFAIVELFLLIISICAVVYFALGDFIMTDPCKKAWNEYEKAVQLIEDSDYKSQGINLLTKSEDGKYAIYKLEGKNAVVVFEIEQGFAISTFFDMSTAKIFSSYDSEESAKSSLPSVKWLNDK